MDYWCVAPLIDHVNAQPVDHFWPNFKWMAADTAQMNEIPTENAIEMIETLNLIRWD